MLWREKTTQLPGTIFGQFSAPIRITTVHNPFEDATVRLAGIGYFDEVSWDRILLSSYRARIVLTRRSSRHQTN